MKMINKILIGLLSGTIVLFVGYSLIKGTYSEESLTFGDVVDEIDYTISVDTSNKLIEYLETGKKVSQILEKMPIGSVICDGTDNSEKSVDDVISTGDIITLGSCSNAANGYTLSVLGDVDGEGTIDIYDISKAYLCFVNATNCSLSSAQKKAADVSFDPSEAYISVDKDKLNMIKDDNEKINWIILPSTSINQIDVWDVDLINSYKYGNGELLHYVNDSGVQLSSANTNIVSVNNDNKGVVTSTTAGSTSVTVTSSDGVTLSVPVEVKNFKNAYDKMDVEWVNSAKRGNGDEIRATDRYNSSVVVSKKMYPNGSDNVVLVSAAGVTFKDTFYDDRGFSDGYVSSALAASLDAPILIVNIEQGADNTKIKDEIASLNPSKIYVVGGTGVISNDIVNSVKGSVADTNVIRLSGGGSIETSVKVAEKVLEIETNKDKKIDVFVTKLDRRNETDNKLNEQYLEAANVSFIAADSDNPKPILYVDAGKTLNDSTNTSTSNNNKNVYNFLNVNKDNINNVYIVGGALKTANNSTCSNNNFVSIECDVRNLMGNDKVHVISGADRAITYNNIVNNFYTNSSVEGKKLLNGVVIVKGYADMIYSSRFAAENDAIVMYHGCDYCNATEEEAFNNRPYELIDSNLSLLLDFKDSLENIYFRMSKDEGNNSFVYRNLMYMINSLNVLNTGNESSYINDVIFSSGKAVFYVPSQGNETLYFSQAISAAVNEIGAENVYVVLLTAGENSGVRADTDFVNEFKNIFPNGMNSTEFVGYRDGEMLNALSKLGISDNNLYTLDELISLTDYNASDKTKVQLGECTKDDCKIIKANLSDYKRLKDSGIKHADVISLMVYFETSKFGDEGVSHFLFSPYIDNPDKTAMGYAAYRHYLTSETWFNNVYLVTYGNASGFDDLYSFELNNNKFNNRIKNAVLEYKKKGNYSKEKGGFGIGYASANTLSGNLFDNLVDAANNRALETKFYVFNKPITTSEIGYNQ